MGEILKLRLGTIHQSQTWNNIQVFIININQSIILRTFILRIKFIQNHLIINLYWNRVSVPVLSNKTCKTRVFLFIEILSDNIYWREFIIWENLILLTIFIWSFLNLLRAEFDGEFLYVLRLYLFTMGHPIQVDSVSAGWFLAAICSAMLQIPPNKYAILVSG